MTLEQLILILLLLLIPLYQLVAPGLRRRLEELARQASKTAAESPSSDLPRVVAPRVDIRGPARRHAPPPLVAPPTARRQTLSPVGNLRDARRGIILMTILGPCRAFGDPGGERFGAFGLDTSRALLARPDQHVT
jgi:hypothetical protein